MLAAGTGGHIQILIFCVFKVFFFFFLALPQVKMLTVEKKVNEILNRLEKTKVERFPDLAAEKEARDREERNEKKAQIQEMKRKEKEEMKKKKELEELR